MNQTARFLDLGADSIVLMDVAAHLQAQYHVSIPVADLFETTDTLTKLHARVVELARSESSDKPQEYTEPKQAPAATAWSAAGTDSTLPGWAGLDRVMDEVDPAFVSEYCSKTPRSKQLAQQARDVLADNRASAGFRLPSKEVVYPIVAKVGEGARIRDEDGNPYLDITMGFGVHLFGHNPPFIREALANAVQEGFVLGPNSPLSGDVARRISRITGHDRVAFCNSGTEAVMTAIRLARNHTGKSRVVLFAHSYHGHSDAVLAYPNGLRSRPAVPGVPEETVANTTVLAYGEEASFDALEALRGEVAAVLVEPVQARNPGFRPFDFLRRLREWTRQHRIVLVFDEMITGFRIAPGGVQELLGFKADLATYGKIAGGGMPLGIVAGDAAILDGIDGGYWQYGDESAPEARTTFFAGTFSKHPLALAASQAALKQIESHGHQFYRQLNTLSDEACLRLNDALRRDGYPGEVRNFGSLFRFFLKGKQDLFFYRLVMNGVYVWEGRNCFLSTAHGPGDIDSLVAAVRESVRGSRSHVNISPSSVGAGHAAEAPTQSFEALESQRQLWALAQIDSVRFSAYNECHALRFTGAVNVGGLRAACATILERNELLRSHLTVDGTAWRLQAQPEIPFRVSEVSTESEAEAFVLEAKRHRFDPVDGPLWMMAFVGLPDGSGYLVANFHHLVVDGWSFSVLLEEIATAYNAECAGQQLRLPEPIPFSRFVGHQKTWLASAQGANDAAYWLSSLVGYEAMPSPMTSVDAGTVSHHFSLSEWNEFKAAARRLGSTLSALLLSAYLPLLWRWRGNDDVVVVVPVSARTFADSAKIVGYCSHLMPLRYASGGATTVGELVAQTQHTMVRGLSHQNYPFSKILTDYRKSGAHSPERLPALGFNLDRALHVPEFSGLQSAVLASHSVATDFEFNMTFAESERGAQLSFQHRLGLLGEQAAREWVEKYLAFLSQISTSDSNVSWREVLALAGIKLKIRERRNEATFSFEVPTTQNLSTGSAQ